MIEGAIIRRRRVGLALVVVGLFFAMMAVPSDGLAASPAVMATSADAAGSSTVKLNGTVDTTACGGTGTSWHFEFGSQQPSNYFYNPEDPSNPRFQGSSPSSWGYVPGGSANQPVTTTIPTDINNGAALTPDVIYFWRVVAVVPNLNPPPPNANCPAGTTYSSIQCFKLGTGSVPCPAQVQATFTVVNKRSRVQDAYVHLVQPGQTGSDGYPTSPDGKFTTTVTPGEVLHFTRTPDITGNCAAPEGGSFPGYAYTVPDNPPSQVTIQVDNTTASDAPETPALSPAERWVVGKINDMRQAKGLKPLLVSTTLDRVAYATAHDAAALKAASGSYPWPPKYCAAVGDDWGWPQLALSDRGFGGNDASTSSPAAALAHWTDTSATDSGAKARTGLTFNPNLTDIGIADGGTAWTMFVGDCSDHSSQPSPFGPGGPTAAPLPAAVTDRCELTADMGDSSIQLPASGSGSGSGSGNGSQSGTGSGTGTGKGTGNGSGSAGGAGLVTATVNSLVTGLKSGLGRLTGHALRKAGGAKFRFTAASVGRAIADCHTGSRRHRLTLMAGARKVRPGTATLPLRLTRGGRKLLQQLSHHPRSVPATCNATFVPSHGKRMTKTTTVTIAP